VLFSFLSKNVAVAWCLLLGFVKRAYVKSMGSTVDAWLEEFIALLLEQQEAL
jgi:hypothetical protein